MIIGKLAACVGKGIFSGVAGTAAMTASNMLEMRLTGRGPSTTPALAVCRALNIELKEEQQKVTFSNAIHWLYGSGWGSVRGLIAFADLEGLSAAAAFLLAVWGAELVMLPSLGVAPPVTQWSRRQITTDALHHLVYALAVDCAFQWLES